MIMKPVIITVNEEKNGYISIKKEEFEKILEKVYLSGIHDGQHIFPISNPLEINRKWEPYCNEKASEKTIPIKFFEVTSFE